VEAVEEKVRLQLAAQRVEPRRRQLRLELRRGDPSIAVALVQHQRRPGAGRRGVDQKLEVQPAAHLHYHRRPELRPLVHANQQRQRRDDDEVRQREERHERHVPRYRLQPIARRLRDPPRRHPPHQQRQRNPQQVIRRLPREGRAQIDSLAWHARQPQNLAVVEHGDEHPERDDRRPRHPALHRWTYLTAPR
jgi:hypothetical protein